MVGRQYTQPGQAYVLAQTGRAGYRLGRGYIRGREGVSAYLDLHGVDLWAIFARMAAPRRRSSAKVSLLAHPLVRRAGILLAVSLGLALLLVVYLFGFDGFFGRVLGATFVWFVLLGVTFLAVVPFVNWAADNWFGRSWAEHPTPQPARKARATNAPKTPAGPRPTRYAPRTPPNSH